MMSPLTRIEWPVDGEGEGGGMGAMVPIGAVIWKAIFVANGDQIVMRESGGHTTPR